MELKDQLTLVFLKAANQNHSEEEIKKFRNIFWWNYRRKESGGLRLTDEGLRFITEECHLKSYPVNFPRDLKMTSQVLIWLDHFIKSPYYITSKTITVLSEKDAFELYLFSGDVKKMGAGKALAKRYAQD
jgi:hypothetical protein